MLAPKLEWTIVVEQPVEPPGERARRSRKNKNLMGPCPQSVSDKTGPAMGAHNYRGDQGKGAGALSAHGPDKRRASQRLHEVRGNQEIGVVLASASMASAGLSYVSIRPAPMAASIARMTKSIDRRLSTTATASVARSRPRARWYNMERNPPAVSAFPVPTKLLGGW